VPVRSLEDARRNECPYASSSPERRSAAVS
jgi:hypothetical protein